MDQIQRCDYSTRFKPNQTESQDRVIMNLVLFIWKCAKRSQNVQSPCAHTVQNVHEKIARCAQMCKRAKMYCCTF